MGERSLLNFGHTIAHALETISNYKLPHGYAVGYGILVESTLSFLLGHLKAEQLLLIKNLFSHLGIIGKHLQKYKINQLMSATKNDKKIRQRKSYYVLLRKIGCAYTVHKDYVYPIEDKMVKLALKNVMGK
ncbi:MAG: 3-dehydroquinate synthase [uncultured bacterium]|nr:MAG: 3-dehydroquinate synthase [uncultured bacterium]